MNDTISARKALSLHGMTGVWREVLDKARIMTLDHEVVLHQLFKAEAAQRVVRFMVYQMRLAYFPSHRDLFEIDFGEQLEFARIECEASGAQGDLLAGFLAADIEHMRGFRERR